MSQQFQHRTLTRVPKKVSEEYFEYTTQTQSLGKLVFTWKIPYFEQQFRVLGTSKKLSSKAFSSELQPQTEWKLSVSQSHLNGKDHLQVSLHAKELAAEVTIVEACILNASGKETFSRKWEVWKHQEDSYLISCDELRSDETYLLDGTLTMQFKIETLSFNSKS